MDVHLEARLCYDCDRGSVLGHRCCLRVRLGRHKRWRFKIRQPIARLLVVGLALAAAAVVLGCGGEEGADRGVPMFRGDRAHTGVNPGPGVEHSPKLLWRFKAGDFVGSSPAVVDGVVYIGSGEGYVYALDAATS